MIALSHPLWPFDSETGPCVKVSAEPWQFLAPSYLFSTLQCQSPESLCALGGLIMASSPLLPPRSFLEPLFPPRIIASSQSMA